MAIYRMKSLPNLAQSKDSSDAMVATFARSHGISSLSYKEYKYLYVAAVMDKLALGAGSSFPSNLTMSFCLKNARDDAEIEAGKKGFDLPGVSGALIAEYNRIEKLTLNAPTFRAHILAREAQALCLSAIISEISKTGGSSVFWGNLSSGSYALDSLADYRKDLKEGLVPKAKLSDFAYLARRLIQSAFKIILQIGPVASVRHLLPVSLLCAKGGFENEEKKGMQVTLDFSEVKTAGKFAAGAGWRLS